MQEKKQQAIEGTLEEIHKDAIAQLEDKYNRSVVERDQLAAQLKTLRE